MRLRSVPLELVPPSAGSVDLARLLGAAESAIRAHRLGPSDENAASALVRELVEASLLEPEAFHFVSMLVEALVFSSTLYTRSPIPHAERSAWRASDASDSAIRQLVSLRAGGAKIVFGRYAPDSLLYTASNRQGTSVVEGSQVVSRHKGVQLLSRLSPLTYLATDRGRSRVYVDQTPGPALNAVERVFLHTQIRKEGPHDELLYVGRIGKKFIFGGPDQHAGPFDALVVHGLSHGNFEEVSPGIFALRTIAAGPSLFAARDGRHWIPHFDFAPAGRFAKVHALGTLGSDRCFVAKVDSGFQFVRGDMRGPTVRKIPFVDYTQECALYPAELQDGSWSVFWDERPGARFDALEPEWGFVRGKPVYVGRRGADYFVVTPEKERGPYRRVRLAISKSSDQLVYAAEKPSGEHWVFDGGKEVGPLDKVTAIFDTPTGAAFAWVRAGVHYVTVSEWTSPPLEDLVLRDAEMPVPCVLEGKLLYETREGRSFRLGYGTSLFGRHDALHASALVVSGLPLYAARDRKSWSLYQGDESLARLSGNPSRITLAGEPADSQHLLVELTYGRSAMEIVSVPIL